MKKILKSLLPKSIIDIYRKILLKQFRNLRNEEIMLKIYKEKWWGSNKQYDSEFYSGSGSHDEDIILPYISAVQDFLKTGRFNVVDVGCGDFNVGSQLYKFSLNYIACDIVLPLIEHNKNKFVDTNLTFQTLDLVNDALPDGDVLIIRQVLQHLSNDNILKAISKFSKYQYLILTEQIPSTEFISNVDIPSGPGVRHFKKSGIVLEDPPFNFKFLRKQEIAKVEDMFDKSYIITILYVLN
ncbi:MAG TPA: class I SAM-dependent methyltransferase [Chitinophagaceae bacterium]|nr:class I SAM-dependent methyltransferase [Chitinophagaceae bacterium]